MTLASTITAALDYIRQRNGKWCVMGHDGKVLGTFQTKKEAVNRLRQIEYFKSQDSIVSTDAVLDSPTRLNNGYLSVWAKVTHPGVFDYSDETFNGSKKLVYRSAEDVFSPSCLDSFTAIDLTDGHPAEAWVTDKSFRTSAIGTVKQVMQDGNWLTANIIIKDKTAIDEVLGGRKYVSVGWLREQVSTPGMTVTDPMTNDEVKVDFQHRKLQANHIALVPVGRAPRAGWGSAICTDYTKEPMDKTTPVTEPTPAVKVEVAEAKVETKPEAAVDTETPTVVEIPVAPIEIEINVNEPEEEAEELVLKSTYDASQAALLAATQRAETAEARITELSNELTQACSPTVLDALVTTRMELTALAQGFQVDAKGMTNTDIKISVLRKAFPNISPDKFASPDYQAALWDVLPQPQPSKSTDVAPITKPSPTSITLDSVNLQAEQAKQTPQAKFQAEYFRAGKAQPRFTSSEK
jgi:hypothetical protein